MATTDRKYQPFTDYIRNSVTNPQLYFEDLKSDGDLIILELRYDGDLAPRTEQENVREIIPEYFLMACRKGVTTDVKGVIRCSENSDYLLFEFEQEWIERIESDTGHPNWTAIRERIIERTTHSYGEEPEI